MPISKFPNVIVVVRSSIMSYLDHLPPFFAFPFATSQWKYLAIGNWPAPNCDLTCFATFYLNFFLRVRPNSSSRQALYCCFLLSPTERRYNTNFEPVTALGSHVLLRSFFIIRSIQNFFYQIRAKLFSLIFTDALTWSKSANNFLDIGFGYCWCCCLVDYFLSKNRRNEAVTITYRVQ